MRRSPPATRFSAADHRRSATAFFACVSIAVLAVNGFATAQDSVTGTRPAADAARVIKHTAVYRTVDGLDIKADVYRSDDQQVRPVVVWIHGGALIMGHREGISGRVKDWALGRGYALVSIDYRLAPETKLPGIISDVEAAFRWIRGDGARQFYLDPERIVVTGGSAGGHLTMSVGFRVKPAPRALLALWGYGDLVGPWLSSPSPHPRHHESKLDRDTAFAQVNGPAVSDSRDRSGDGAGFYQYCRRQGIWPLQVSGWDPLAEAEKFHPYMAVKNVTPDYPPIVMIHGTTDTDVPYEQSAMMAEQLKHHGVRHRLLTIPDGEHGLVGGDPALIDRAYEEAFQFLDEALER